MRDHRSPALFTFVFGGCTVVLHHPLEVADNFGRNPIPHERSGVDIGSRRRLGRGVVPHVAQGLLKVGRLLGFVVHMGVIERGEGVILISVKGESLFLLLLLGWHGQGTVKLIQVARGSRGQLGHLSTADGRREAGTRRRSGLLGELGRGRVQNGPQNIG